MKYIIVADKDLVRIAARIENVLAEEHDCETWTYDQLQAQFKNLGPDTGILSVGTSLAERLGRERLQVEHDEETTRWGRIGHSAVVWTEPGDKNLMMRAAQCDSRLGTIKAEAKRRRQAAEEAGHARGSGARMSHRFIRREHEHDPRETVQMSDGVAFTLDRMVWEKEYTVAVAWFLLEGFPRFHLDLLRQQSKRALSKVKKG